MKDASTLLSASADSTARIWRAGDNNTYSAVHTLKVCDPCAPTRFGLKPLNTTATQELDAASVQPALDDHPSRCGWSLVADPTLEVSLYTQKQLQLCLS